MSRHDKRAMRAVEVPSARGKTDWKQLAEETDPERVRDVITSQTNAWGGGLLVLGVLQLLPGTPLDHVWGVALLLVAVISFVFSSAALMAVYGVIMVWAMILNLLSGELLWMGFALFQAYLAFRTFQQFAILRRTADRLGIDLGPGGPHKAAEVFPWAGCGLTAAAWIAAAILFFVVVWYEMNGQSLSEEATGQAMMGVIDVVVLGVALGLAAFLARFRFRAVSLLAVLGGGLMIGGLVILVALT